MGAFHDAMLRDLEIRGYSPKTCELYLRAMRELVRFHMRAPDRLTPEDINRYQHHLIRERGVSFSAFNIAVSAFRFFYTHTVAVDWQVARLPYQKTPRRLPVILSRDEVLRIFGAVTNPWHRVMLMAIYAGGLRLGEVRGLRVGDVDEARMTVRVRSGKGGKDRYVPLSRTLLAALRPRLAGQPPDAWLFPGATAGKPLNATTIQRVFKRAAQGADIRKRVSIHSLRHAFATHMLEDGAHIRAVQQVLGHQSLSTTTIYIHCTPSYVRRLRSPLDRIARDPGDDRGAGG